MFRSSDHDPVLVGLHLDKSLAYDLNPTLNTVEVLDGDATTLTISNAFKEDQTSYFAIYDINGQMVMKHAKPEKIESEEHTVDLPSLPGIYILQIYYDHKVYPYKFIVQ